MCVFVCNSLHLLEIKTIIRVEWGMWAPSTSQGFRVCPPCLPSCSGRSQSHIFSTWEPRLIEIHVCKEILTWSFIFSKLDGFGTALSQLCCPNHRARLLHVLNAAVKLLYSPSPHFSFCLSSLLPLGHSVSVLPSQALGKRREMIRNHPSEQMLLLVSKRGGR